MLVFTTLPFVATLVQLFFYGVSLINIAFVIDTTLFYIFVLMDMNDTVKRAMEREIEVLKEEQQNMHKMFVQTAEALASAIDAKDTYTHGHSARVAEYSKQIARLAGKDEKECREVYFAALLHDVGKIGIPDYIINKAGKLNDDEFSEIRKHPEIGRQILQNIIQSPYISIGAHYHHERYDGSGYPDGLKGSEIPEIARIIAVADAYDAMASKRSYRDPLAQNIVREEIEKGLGTQFDPTFATIMLKLIDTDKDYLMRER
jgi:HD-GYP domain-containing protein (c-di-GMP phosphodiesterase class II)